MWNFWENVSILNHFKAFFFEHDNVVIHAEVEDYNSKESFNVQQQFFKQLVGSYTDVIHSMVGDNGNERFPDFTTTWFTSVTLTKKICGTPGYARAKLTDLVYTDHSTSLLIKEQFLAGSIPVLAKLLENLDILALMAVQGEMYTKYRVDAGVGKPKNSEVLMSMIDNTKIFPNEASVFMHNLYNKNLDANKNFILHHSPLHKQNFVQNPWFAIAEDYIQVKSPWKYLPKNHRSIAYFWTTNNQKKSDRLKDNTVDFIRENEK